MIVRKLCPNDITEYVPGLLRSNDSPGLHDHYIKFNPDDVFGAFSDGKLLGVMSAVDSYGLFAYDVLENQVIKQTTSVLFGAYVTPEHRRSNVYRRLFTAATQYMYRNYACGTVAALTLPIYKDGEPITLSKNRDSWLSNPSYDYDTKSLFKPLAYTDISLRPDNASVCSHLTSHGFKYVGLNAYDNSPIFAANLTNLRL